MNLQKAHDEAKQALKHVNQAIKECDTNVKQFLWIEDAYVNLLTFVSMLEHEKLADRKDET